MARKWLLPLLVLLCAVFGVRAEDDAWIVPYASGQPQIRLYFFWSLTCPHCTAAHPHVFAIPEQRGIDVAAIKGIGSPSRQRPLSP